MKKNQDITKESELETKEVESEIELENDSVKENLDTKGDMQGKKSKGHKVKELSNFKLIILSVLKVLLGAYSLGILIELNLTLTNFVYGFVYKIFEMKYMAANLVNWANIVRSPILAFLSVVPIIISSLAIAVLISHMFSKMKYVFYKGEPEKTKLYLSIFTLATLLATVLL